MVTGFKCVRIHKSLEIRVKNLVRYCANTITSPGRVKKRTMRKGEHSSLWRSESNCSFCEVKWELGQVTCFYSSVSVRVTRPIVGVRAVTVLQPTCVSLYMANQNQPAFLEHRSIFSATVLWKAHCHIYNRRNQCFKKKKITKSACSDVA